MKLSNRLVSIANLVDGNDIVADIGCDHALLDIYLVKNNIINKSLACDINKNALEMGIKNIKKYKLDDKIKTLLCDGISLIDSEVNTLIISGMGASTIIKILSNDKINNINKVITQSNNDYELLRRFMINNSFYISYEESICDNDKYYLNIVFKRGYKYYSNNEIRFGTKLLVDNFNYYKYLYDKYSYIYSNIPIYKFKKKISMIKDIKYLKKLMNR